MCIIASGTSRHVGGRDTHTHPHIHIHKPHQACNHDALPEGEEEDGLYAEELGHGVVGLQGGVE